MTEEEEMPEWMLENLSTSWKVYDGERYGKGEARMAKQVEMTRARSRGRLE